MSTPETPLFFLPGMAADPRIFESQRVAFPNLTVLSYVPPFHREPLRHYAARLAKTVPTTGSMVLGGASFGGIVALEMARVLPTAAVILIGSAQSRAVPWRHRLLTPLAWAGPNAIQRVARFGSRVLPPRTARGLSKLAAPESAFARWALCAVLTWRPQRCPIRIFHIHGEKDPIFPVHLARPDVIVPDGGHALSLFHAAEVNAFIRDCLAVIPSPA